MVTIHNNEDIFTSQCDYIVNPINCVGVMGKGLALEFKKRYPSMFFDYSKRCWEHTIKPGIPYLYGNIINFPTKNHWKNPSKIEWIINGLEIIHNKFKNCSIAISPIGCGCGGLNKDVVIDYMKQIFYNSSIDLHIYIK